MTKTLEERVTQSEGLIRSLLASSTELTQRCDEMEARLGAKRTRARQAGGTFRERLLDLFNKEPERYFRPGELAEALKLERMYQVPLAQACKGLVKEGLLETRPNYRTERPEYKLKGEG